MVVVFRFSAYFSRDDAPIAGHGEVRRRSSLGERAHPSLKVDPLGRGTLQRVLSDCLRSASVIHTYLSKDLFFFSFLWTNRFAWPSLEGGRGGGKAHH